VPHNAADREAAATTIAGAAEPNGSEKGKERAVEPSTVLQEHMNGGAITPTTNATKVVENGEVTTERPTLETFVTAASSFPTLSKEA